MRPRRGEGGPGDHRVVGLEGLEAPEQRIDRGVPGLVRRGVGELVGTGHIARGVGCWGSWSARYALVCTVRPTGMPSSSRPKPLSRAVRPTAHSRRSKLDAAARHRLAIPRRGSGAPRHLEPSRSQRQRLVAGENLHTIGFERSSAARARDTSVVLAHRGCAAPSPPASPAIPAARKALRQFAADGPAAQHHQACRQLTQAPQRVAGQRSPPRPAPAGAARRACAPVAMTMPARGERPGACHRRVSIDDRPRIDDILA